MLDYVKVMLRDFVSVFDVIYEVGLFGVGCLYDLFVIYEVMMLGVYCNCGVGLKIVYGFYFFLFG